MKGGEHMGIEDRDWYREAYREKEKKYGTDFSGKPSFKIITGTPRKKKGMGTILIYLLMIAIAVAIVMALNNPSIGSALKKMMGR